MTTATAYPLNWPDTLPRRRADLRVIRLRGETIKSVQKAMREGF